MRWARKPGTPGEDPWLRLASGNRGLALVVGLIVLTAAPVCYGAVFPQPVTFVETPVASAVDRESMPTPPTDPPDVTGPATAPAVARRRPPHPLATPSPTGANRLFALTTTTCAGLHRLNAIDIARHARAAGFPDSQVAVAVAVALAESAGYPTATNHNTNGSIDFGLWQINTVHGALLTTGAWCVPADNAAMAHTVWTRAGGSWTPWATYNSGSYLTHLAAANRAAQALGVPTAPAPTTTPAGTPAQTLPPAIKTSAPGGTATPATTTPATTTPATTTPPPATAGSAASPTADMPTATAEPAQSTAAGWPPRTRSRRRSPRRLNRIRPSSPPQRPPEPSEWIHTQRPARWSGVPLLFGFNFAPAGWALCQGQLLSIAENTALFSLLGTTYGGDGRVTFALPDLRGRAPVGFGQEPGGADYPQGEARSQGPSSQSADAGEISPGYVALNWCIALQGVYPSRP